MTDSSTSMKAALPKLTKAGGGYQVFALKFNAYAAMYDFADALEEGFELPTSQNIVLTDELDSVGRTVCPFVSFMIEEAWSGSR